MKEQESECERAVGCRGSGVKCRVPGIRCRVALLLSVIAFVCASVLTLPAFSRDPSAPSRPEISDLKFEKSDSDLKFEKPDSDLKFEESDLLEVGSAPNLSNAEKEPAEFKVVSYNIRWRGGDELRELIDHLKHDQEIGGAAIIGLQEVDRNKKRTGNKNTIKLIASELHKHYAWAAPPAIKNNAEEETGVAILSNYPLSDVRRIVLPHEGPGDRRRAAIGATVNLGGTLLRFYSVHSENRISKQKKIEQMTAVLEDLKQYPKVPHAIVVGDLNTWEKGAVKRTSALFTKENFTTPFANGESTFLQKIFLVPIKFKLDWVWLRGLEATSYGIDKKISLSDHFPLWAVVKFKR
ncbi:MAG TPA: endonuclease/exonuclease/phosphatase family protein [Pyrinomonadaceae bacterium]|nr:endonuclease/exonuclease/phosphatase family protein [Pyrinomonadaceae bacterium]